MKGPGDPNCPTCGGEGIVLAQSGGAHPPSFRRCACTLQKDIAANVNRGMGRLMDAPIVKTSVFTDHLTSDLWVTGSQTAFMAHLRHVAVRQLPSWFFKVTTDADLMSAWLANIAVEGKEILDKEIQIYLEHIRLEDLVLPPELLIIRLGVKRARNAAMPEVLMETFQARNHVNKPTWVWDTPNNPFTPEVPGWSQAVADHLSTWKHSILSGGDRPMGFTELGLGGRPVAPALSDARVIPRERPVDERERTEDERERERAAKIAALSPEALEELRQKMESRGLDTSKLPPPKGSKQ